MVAQVHVAEFQPKTGVKIETDPNATSLSNGVGSDDADVIESLISKLEVLSGFCHSTLFGIQPMQIPILQGAALTKIHN